MNGHKKILMMTKMGETLHMLTCLKATTRIIAEPGELYLSHLNPKAGTVQQTAKKI